MYIQRYGINFFIGLLLIFSFITSAKAAEKFKLDPMHTYVLWHIKHFDFSTQTGKWLAEGDLIIDKNKLQNSKVNVTIHVAKIITGIEELDKHLRGKLFFDVEKFPLATFVSDKVEVTGKETAKVHGILTVHGVSKPVTLDVKLNKAGINPISNKPTVGFSATTALKRSDFDISTLLPGLGDTVNLEIGAEAYKVE